MTSIAWAVARFKDNPLEHLDHRLVLEACASAGHVWRRRGTSGVGGCWTRSSPFV